MVSNTVNSNTKEEMDSELSTTRIHNIQPLFKLAGDRSMFFLASCEM
jgi:hypothetical protein